LVAAPLTGQLAEARTHERRLDQLARLLLDAREDAERGPPLHVVEPEQHQRSPDRVDLTAHPEEGGVDVAQQAVAESDVARHERLELAQVDARVLKRRDELEDREPVRRHAARFHALGLAEEVPLEEVEAECLAALVVLLGLDLLGEQRAVVTRQARDVVGHGLGIAAEQLDLHDVDVLEQRRALLAPAEVVERDRVAVLTVVRERGDQVVVDLLVLEQLEHHAAAGKRPRERAHEEVARHVDPGEPLAHDLVETDLGERVHHDGGSRLVVVGEHRDVLVGAAEQKLVSHHVERRIEDRLPRDEDARHAHPQCCEHAPFEVGRPRTPAA
jgi:hypothetical protein